MLIEFLFEKFPSLEVVNDQAIGDLEVRYKFECPVVFQIMFGYIIHR